MSVDKPCHCILFNRPRCWPSYILRNRLVEPYIIHNLLALHHTNKCPRGKRFGGKNQLPVLMMMMELKLSFKMFYFFF
jgi:hypothetical protein